MGRAVHAAQNRFFAWCDPRLIDQVKIGAAAHQFAVENNPGHFHPGATSAPTRHFRGHPQRHYPFPYKPVEVYVLRWIAGQTAGIPEFDPK
jgi:hypothetical protein